MFSNINKQTDIYIYYYKYFILNKYWNDYLNNKITYIDYYKYNDLYLNQIYLNNIINNL